MDLLRRVCPDLRPGDVELPLEDVTRLADVLVPPSTRLAVHGRGDNWTEVGPGYNPYQTSPLVNSAPQFGGRWRNDFPGSGDQHVNDDSDKQKDTKGHGNDFDPVTRHNLINDKMGPSGRSFVVRITLPPDQVATDDVATDILGQDGRHDGESVYVVVDDFMEALRIERKQRAHGRSVRIETAK